LDRNSKPCRKRRHTSAYSDRGPSPHSPTLSLVVTIFDKQKGVNIALKHINHSSSPSSPHFCCRVNPQYPVGPWASVAVFLTPRLLTWCFITMYMYERTKLQPDQVSAKQTLTKRHPEDLLSRFYTLNSGRFNYGRPLVSLPPPPQIYLASFSPWAACIP
jgi:hypothetical protein